jgi:hypothetical protein
LQRAKFTQRSLILEFGVETLSAALVRAGKILFHWQLSISEYQNYNNLILFEDWQRERTKRNAANNICMLFVLLTVVVLLLLGIVNIINTNTVRSESRCALRLRYVDLVVRIEVAVEVCCCFTVFSG